MSQTQKLQNSTCSQKFIKMIILVDQQQAQLIAILQVFLSIQTTTYIRKDIPSYLQDTNIFLTLNHVSHIPKESLQETLDVKSLYTNISNNECIKAVREAHDKHPSKTVSAKVIITFLRLILIEITLYSAALTICKLWDVQWTQFVLQHMLIFLWHNSTQSIYILTFMAKLYYF